MQNNDLVSRASLLRKIKNMTERLRNTPSWELWSSWDEMSAVIFWINMCEEIIASAKPVKVPQSEVESKSAIIRSLTP